MSNPIKKTTFKALVDGTLVDLAPKTSGEQIYLNGDTNLAAKMAEMVSAINLRAKTADVNTQIESLEAEISSTEAAVGTKANAADVNAQINELTSLIDGITGEIALLAKTADVNTQVDNLRQEILGDVPVEAYDTFTELAAYIAEHQDIADSLSAAIGGKADVSTVNDLRTSLSALETALNSLGALADKDQVSESDLDSSLREKINAASDGNHSHSNKSTLDGITASKVAEWDAKGKFYVSSSIPSGITPNDLLFKVL